MPDHPKVVHTRADLTSPEARAALEHVDVLWHLGAQLWRSRDGRQIEINIGGTENVVAARPGHMVFASSAAVYGAHPDNPLPITEEWTPRPNNECPYAWHKLAAERVCADAVPTAVMRICSVFGPHVDPQVGKAAQGYKVAVPTFRGAPLAMQFLDEDDAAAALLAAGERRVTGLYNLATTDWLDAPGIAALSGGRVITLPRRLAISATEAAYRLRLLPFGADRSSLADGPLALDPALAGAALDWKPTWTSGEVLARALGLQAGR